MALFHSGTSPSSGSYREIVNRLVACATSKYVSAVALNAAGTGYTVGDVLTIPHAGGYQLATIEVLTISGGGGTGPIATFALRNMGAYGNRVASVAVNAGGSGYTNGSTQVARLTTGTATQQCKLLLTVSGGAVTSAAVFETGGHYTVDPSAAGATNADIGIGAGTGFTCTATMTGLIGTSAIAVTGGTGSSATFNLTLTDGGWTCLVDRNDYTFNSVTDEKEIILRGTVAGGLPPLVGLRTYTATSGTTRYGTLLVGMDSFNSSLTFDTQPNVGPNTSPSSQTGICWLMYDNAQPYWFRVTPRCIVANVKAVGGAVTTDMSMYAGLLNPFGTQSEAPYPMYLSGTTGAHNRRPEDGGSFVTGLTEGCTDAAAQRAAVFRRASDGSWQPVYNVVNATTVNAGFVIAPVGSNAIPASGTAVDQIVGNGQLALIVGGTGISQTNQGAPTQLLMPVTILTGDTTANDSETLPRGELDGVFWLSATKSDATKMVREDTVTVAGIRYIVFQNAHRTENYTFFALKAG